MEGRRPQRNARAKPRRPAGRAAGATVCEVSRSQVPEGSQGLQQEKMSHREAPCEGRMRFDISTRGWRFRLPFENPPTSPAEPASRGPCEACRMATSSRWGFKQGKPCHGEAGQISKNDGVRSYKQRAPGRSVLGGQRRPTNHCTFGPDGNSGPFPGASPSSCPPSFSPIRKRVGRCCLRARRPRPLAAAASTS